MIHVICSSLAILDPFQSDPELMRDWGLTPNRTLVETSRAFHAWCARMRR
jgi:hypothetical protein